MWSWQPPMILPCQLSSSMRIPIIFKLFANNAEHRPTVCQHCWTWPNYLPSLPNCLPTLPNTDQLFSSSAKDRSTVCQSLVTSIIRLNPSSFLGFLFSFQNSVFLCFLFFTGGQLGALYTWLIAAESLGNLNMNGDQMFGVWSGCIFYVLITIVSLSFYFK